MATQPFNIKSRDEFSPEEMKRFENIFRKLPARSMQFNKFGLRYPVNALNSLGKRIIFFPIEVMADFVDVVTKTRCDSKERMPDITWHEFEKHYNRANATSIGNLAYVALNSAHEASRVQCLSILEEVYKIEIKKRN